MSITMLAESAKTFNINEEKIYNNFNKIINSLDSISEEVIHSDASVVPVINIDKSYAVTLESLIEVSEAYDVSIEESAKMIKELNKIDESARICCVLPENINEQVTVEEFCDLVNYLNENNINTGWVNTLSTDEFVTESTKISEIFSKISAGLKNSFSKMKKDNLEKNIANAEKYNSQLKEELDKFKKMDPDKQKAYVIKNTATTYGTLALITFGTTYAIAGGGSLLLIKFIAAGQDIAKLIKGIRLTAVTVSYTTGMVYLINKTSKKPIAFTPKMYKTALNNSIKYNNLVISNSKKALKELEAKK